MVLVKLYADGAHGVPLGEKVNPATGFGVTVTVRHLVNTLPEASVTVKVRTYVPVTGHTMLMLATVGLGLIDGVAGPEVIAHW